jgi:hypothetical protein
MKTMLGVMLAVVVGATPVASRANEYLPLDTGWVWTYEDSTRQTAVTMEVLGDYTVRGRATRVVRETRSGMFPQITETYWSTNDEGDLFVHGARNLSYNIESAYEPPLLWVDAPMALSTTWTTSALIYPDLNGAGEPQGPFDFTMTVASDEEISVPAGTFASFGIAFAISDPNVLPSINGKGWSDRVAIAFGAEPTWWFTDGVGIPRFWSGTWLLLTNWADPSTATEATSWGKVKALFY